MEFITSLPTTIAGLSPRDWTNFVSFLLTPAVFAWFFPGRRYFIAIVASSTLFVLGVCIWQKQPLDFSLGITAVIALVLIVLCAAIMLLRLAISRILRRPINPQAQ